MLPPETRDYQNWELKPRTVYYLAPGRAPRQLQRQRGGRVRRGVRRRRREHARRRGTSGRIAIDSNITTGEQGNVTIAYLTIQKFTPPVDQTAINQTGAGGWKLLNSTVTLNVPGGGMFAATDNVLRNNCLTRNGQYGFQSAQTLRGDALTGGPYNVWIENNEISYNDTCDLSGLLNNAALGWKDHNPVPAEFRNPHCGMVKGDGNQGGFKLWGTNGVMIRKNWIHHNWGVGGWADTNNANTTWTGQHDHGQRERGDLGGDLLQLLDHRQLHRPEQPDRTARTTPASPCRPSTSRSPEATPRTAACPRAACPRASRRACPVTPTGRSSQATPSWTTVAGCSCGRTPTATAATGSTASARSSRAAAKGPFSKDGLRGEPPGATVDTGTHLGQGHRIARAELLGRLHVADAERRRHAAT